MKAELEIEADSLITRNRAQEIAEEAIEGDYSALDLSNVEFISRSVADELLHYHKEHDLGLNNVQEDVDEMLSAVDGAPVAA